MILRSSSKEINRISFDDDILESLNNIKEIEGITSSVSENEQLDFWMRELAKSSSIIFTNRKHNIQNFQQQYLSFLMPILNFQNTRTD